MSFELQAGSPAIGDWTSRFTRSMSEVIGVAHVNERRARVAGIKAARVLVELINIV